MASTSRSSGGWHEARATQPRDNRTLRSDSRYNDDDYMAQIEQYKNQPWYNKLLENPWLWSRQGDFSPNLLQQLSQAFGDTSAADNYYNQIRSNQFQWLADTLAQYHQQDYESAPNQAELTKQAGLNPDLAGIAESPAAENDQPMMVTPPSGFGSEEAITGIANFGINFVSSVLGFAQQIQQFKANQISNDSGLIELHNDSLDLMLKELENTITVPDDFDWKDSDKVNDLILEASEKIDWSSYPKRIRRMMQTYSANLRKDPITGKEPAKLTLLREQLANKILGERIGRADKTSHEWFDDDIRVMSKKIGEITTKYTDKLARLNTEYQELINRAQEVETEVAENTQDERTSAENQHYKTQELLDRQQELMESMYNEIYEFCKSPEAGLLGSIGLIFLPFLRQFASSIASSNFSFGRSSIHKNVTGGENSTLNVFRHGSAF